MFEMFSNTKITRGGLTIDTANETLVVDHNHTKYNLSPRQTDILAMLMTFSVHYLPEDFFKGYGEILSPDSACFYVSSLKKLVPELNIRSLKYAGHLLLPQEE